MDVHSEQRVHDRDYIPAKVAKVDTGIGIHKVYVEHEKTEENQEDQIHGDVIEEEIPPDVNDEEDIVEYVEEYSYGQVVRDDNGQFYVVMDKETPDFDFEKLNNVQIILNDDGSKTLLLEDISERELLLNANDPSTSAAAGSKVYNLKNDQMVNVGTEGGEQGFENEQGEDCNEKGYDRGLKQRRSRVYGSCKCPECDQAFVNTARLERHLAVHQVFGSFLCPLCGKTYKYEYNLFYHWRRTCRDMNELITVHERKNMEVTNLRQLVEEIAQKKQKIGPLDLGISNHHLYRTVHSVEQFDGRRTASCKECGVTTLEMHLPRHYAVHRREVPVDEKLLGGGYFCDLCGLMFRQHCNLIKHWRTGCLEINDNLPRDCDLALDDMALKAMVFDLMKKATANVQKAAAKQKMAFSGGLDHHHHQLTDRSRRGSNNPFDDVVDDLGGEENGGVADNEDERTTMSHHHLGEIDAAGGPSTSTEHHRHMISSQQQSIMEHGSNGSGQNVDQNGAQQNQTSGVSSTSFANSSKQRYMRDDDNGANGVEPPPGGVDHIDVVNNTATVVGGPGPSGSRDEMDDRWAGDQGMIFADDLIDDEDMLMINDDGQLCSMDMKSNMVPPPESSYAMPGAMEMTSGYGDMHPMQQHDGYGAAVRPSQAVQCYECFRSFANMARLERHMAGAHSSYGTHHCILCGNRFKYDYNLLYHYRRSCPYTKAMIETDVREQLDAISLKKLIRTLASKENRLASAAQSIGIGGSGAEYGRSDLGDSMIRRQMIRSVMPGNSAHNANGTPILIPPASAQSSSAIRPGIEGKKCPICSIMFYGANVLMRHLRVAHPGEYELFEPEMDGDEGQEEEEEEVFQTIREDHHIPHQHGIEVEDYVENEIVPEDCGELDEPPPTLHPEPDVVDDHPNAEELAAAGIEMTGRGGVSAQRLPSGSIYG